jgi:hypothetical protein
VAEKQRETQSVDRLPSTPTTTACKSVQVNGAATVSALPALHSTQASRVCPDSDDGLSVVCAFISLYEFTEVFYFR